VDLITGTEAAPTPEPQTDTGGARKGGGKKPPECRERTYQTYTKTNPDNGKVYSGRTSGFGTPDENVAARDRNHHMNEQGYGPAELDLSSLNNLAIRGREQQLIDANGGACSTGGTSGNAINGVSPSNPRGQDYADAANSAVPQVYLQ
jgi:hypothetical protein